MTTPEMCSIPLGWMLTMKRGAAENKNVSGILRQMKQSEVRETNEVMALSQWQHSIAQPLGRWCKLRGLSTAPCDHQADLLSRFDGHVPGHFVTLPPQWVCTHTCAIAQLFSAHLEQTRNLFHNGKKMALNFSSDLEEQHIQNALWTFLRVNVHTYIRIGSIMARDNDESVPREPRASVTAMWFNNLLSGINSVQLHRHTSR